MAEIYNKKTNDGKVAYIAVGVWVIITVLAYFSIKARRGFWGLDISLFWRYAENPELFRHTSPVVAAVLEANPGLSVKALEWLVRMGITQANGYQVVNLIFVTLSTSFVCIGFYNAFRGMGHKAINSAFGVMLATSAPLFIGYSRMHPLSTVMTHGGLSMLAMSICIMSVGFFVRGRFYAGGLLASLVTLIHPVTGTLISFLIFTGAVYDRLKGNTAVSLPRIMVLGSTMILIASPFVINMLFSGVGTVSIDSDIFFSYVNARSSNPMPLRDGLDHVYAHFAVFFSVIVMMKYWPETMEVIGRLKYAAYFWLFCYLFQIYASEFIRSPELTRLVLHRISPVLFFIFATVMVSHVLLSLKKGRYFVVLVLLFAMFIADNKTRLLENWHTYDLAFWALLSSFLLHHSFRGKPIFSFYKGYVAFLFLYILLCCAPVLVNWPINFRLNWDWLLFSIFAVCFFRKFENCAFIKHMNIWFRRFVPSLPVMLILFLLIKTILMIKNGGDVLSPNYKMFRFYSRIDAVELVRDNMEITETVFCPVDIDLNGVRRQYLDWKHEWYALYMPDMITGIIRRVEALGIDVMNDKKIDGFCGKYRWLFSCRCVSNVLDVDSKIREFDWRSNWARLKKIDPSLSKVLIWAKNIEDGDKVVARNEQFALISPKSVN